MHSMTNDSEAILLLNFLTLFVPDGSPVTQSGLSLALQSESEAAADQVEALEAKLREAELVAEPLEKREHLSTSWSDTGGIEAYMKERHTHKETHTHTYLI